MPKYTKNKKRKSKRPTKNWGEEHVAQALVEIASGNSIRSTAVKYGMSDGLLRWRIKMKHNNEVLKVAGRRKTLTSEQEQELAKCINAMCKTGFSPTRAEIKNLVKEYVQLHNIKTPFKDHRPGKHWLRMFMERNDLSIKKANMISTARLSEEASQTPSKLSVPDSSTPMSGNMTTLTTNIANAPKCLPGGAGIQTPSLPVSSSATEIRCNFCKVLGPKPTVIVPGKSWVPVLVWSLQDNHSKSFEELILDKMKGPQEKIVKTRKKIDMKAKVVTVPEYLKDLREKEEASKPKPCGKIEFGVVGRKKKTVKMKVIVESESEEDTKSEDYLEEMEIVKTEIDDEEEKGYIDSGRR